MSDQNEQNQKEASSSENVTTAENRTAESNNFELDQINNFDANQGTIFSMSKPRHAADGFGKGVGNILKGTLGGAALIVTAPIAGAMEGSNRGNRNILKL